MELFLLQLFIYLAAAAIAVPIAKKLGLGSVLGYLIAGIVIGPFGLSLIGEVEEVMHFTEFGVVMMLFIVGLELKPSLLKQMKVAILGMGGMQVVLSATVIGLISAIFIPWQQALAVGLVLALSSTALVLQTLKEKNLNNTETGRSVFSVLLFQDLAVIPMLALLPLLATIVPHDDGHAQAALLDISSLPSYLQIIVTLGAILFVFFAARYATRPLFRIIASTHIRELFVATALALVVGISLLMTVVGLSSALGTFLAGVVLADSEYRHELESDLEPFKGLLLGIFFISIGASLDFHLIGENLLVIIAITIGLMLVKWVILLLVGKVFGMTRQKGMFFAVALAQGGEFAFVLFQFTSSNGIVSGELTEILISAVAISMFLAPLLYQLYGYLAAKKQVDNKEEIKADDFERSGHKVILAGFGRFGKALGRFLVSAGVKPVILDYDASNLELFRKFGFEVYYGDVTRLDLLEAAGLSEAEVLVISSNNIDLAKKLVPLVRKHYPHIKIVANALDIMSSYELRDLGVDELKRSVFASALDLGQDVLTIIGMEPYEAYRLKRLFKKHDQDMQNELYKRRNEGEESYITHYQEYMALIEEQMNLDETMEHESDMAWTTKSDF